MCLVSAHAQTLNEYLNTKKYLDVQFEDNCPDNRVSVSALIYIFYNVCVSFCVCVYVLSVYMCILYMYMYNYSYIFTYTEELQRQRLKPSSKWRSEFAEYISTVPNYYAQVCAFNT